MPSASSDNYINRFTPEDRDFRAILENALESGEFVPWYQPQYDYTCGKIVSSEALVRWNRNGTIIPPGNFIPFMESTGLVSELDRRIWEEVAKQQREWLREGVPVLPASVNISRRDLTRGDTVSFLAALPARFEIPAELIRLEITESAYMDDSGLLSDSIAALRDAGFMVEIDDFGSGFSSLNMLKDIQVDVLKLDMGFLSGNSSRGGTILSAILSMARNLDLDVIAEGVETKPQADYLNSIGCAVMQGYLFYRPQPAEEYRKLLCSGAALSTPVSLKAGKGVGEAVDFLDADTQATLLFNSFLGGAAIIEQYNDTIKFLRTNDRFYTEFNTDRAGFAEKNFFSRESFSERFYKGLFRALDNAYETDEERAVELCAVKVAAEPVWIRVHVRFLAEKQGSRIYYMSIENITARRQLQDRNRRLSAELSAMVNSVPDGIARLRVSKGAGTFEFANETLARVFGREPGELLSALQEDPYAFVHPEDRDYIRRVFSFSFSSFSPIHTQCRTPMRGGKYHVFDIRGDYGDSTGEAAGDAVLYLSFTDITDLLKAETELRRTQAEFSSAVEQSGLMICRYNPEDRALVVSEETAKRFDSVTYMPDVRESMIRDGYVAKESAGAWDQMFAVLEAGKAGECPSLCLKGLHGMWKWYKVSWRPLLFDGKLGSAVLCFRDITSEKSRSDMQRHEIDRLRQEGNEVRQALRRNAGRDDLTGLCTRGTAEALIGSLLAENVKRTSLFILADMDDLKALNDSCGHAAGDEALRRLTSLLATHFARKNVVTARLGGDEFLVFIPDAGNTADQASVLDSFFVKLGQIRVGPRNSLPLRCSMGCVLTQPGGNESFERLYARADRALYHVKRSLKNYYVFWQPSMEEDGERRKDSSGAGTGAGTGAELAAGAGTGKEAGTGTGTVAGEAVSVRQADMFDPENMGSLLELLSDFSPMVLSINFERNQYYLLRSSAPYVKNLPRFGAIRELLPLLNARANGGTGEAEHFVSSVRAAFSAGKTVLRANTIQPDDRGNPCRIETLLQLYQSRGGELCGFAISKEDTGR